MEGKISVKVKDFVRFVFMIVESLNKVRIIVNFFG